MYRVFLILAAVIPLCAQLQNPLNLLLNVVSQPAGFPGLVAAGDAELQVTNKSGKSIVAYEVAVTSGSGQGKETRIADSDLVPSLVSESRVAPGHDNRYLHVGPLRPGAVLAQLFGKYSPGTKVSVMGIVFDDNTIAGDSEWAEASFEEHAFCAAELDALVSELRSSPIPDLRRRIETLRQDLSRRWPAGSVDAETIAQATGVGLARVNFMEKLSELTADSLTDQQIADRYSEAIPYLLELVTAFREHSHMASN
jgi:hypothetical protein